LVCTENAGSPSVADARQGHSAANATALDSIHTLSPDRDDMRVFLIALVGAIIRYLVHTSRRRFTATSRRTPRALNQATVTRQGSKVFPKWKELLRPASQIPLVQSIGMT
jgi:hypothetical protein